jgi:hypothetical protein
MENQKESLLHVIWTRLPWTDFFWALFLPMNLLSVGMYYKKPLVGIGLLSLCCIAYFVYYLIRFKKVSLFPVFTFVITMVHFFSSFLKAHPQTEKIIDICADAFPGLLFLVTLFMAKPMILYFIDESTLEKIPERIRKSPAYMKSWKIVTAMWGVAYVFTALLMAYLESIHFKGAGILSFLFGWPMVVALLIISVIFPISYMNKNVGKN